MGILHGKNLKIELKVGASGSYADISDICNSIEFNDNTEASESTTFASEGWQEFTDGMGSADFKADGFYDQDQFDNLIDARSAATRYVKIYPAGDGATGLPTVELELRGLQIGFKGENADNIGLSWEGTVTGPPTYGVTS